MVHCAGENMDEYGSATGAGTEVLYVQSVWGIWLWWCGAIFCTIESLQGELLQQPPARRSYRWGRHDKASLTPENVVYGDHLPVDVLLQYQRSTSRCGHSSYLVTIVLANFCDKYRTNVDAHWQVRKGPARYRAPLKCGVRWRLISRLPDREKLLCLNSQSEQHYSSKHGDIATELEDWIWFSRLISDMGQISQPSNLMEH